MVNSSKGRRWKRNRGMGLFLFFFVFGVLGRGMGQELSIRLDKPGAPIQPTMWGIFFEDINMAADGGLYAELVKNRSFEFNDPMMGWKGKGLILNRSAESPDNPRFIRV